MITEMSNDEIEVNWARRRELLIDLPDPDGPLDHNNVGLVGLGGHVDDTLILVF